MAESDSEREARYEQERRAEANAVAHDVSPQAGEELAEGSEAREAKLKLKRDAAKRDKKS